MPAKPIELVFFSKLIVVLVYLGPDLVREQSDFLLRVDVDELLCAKYLPDNSVLIKVVKEYSWVPAIGRRISFSFYPICTTSLLLQICCKDDSLTYRIVFVLTYCVNHCRVDKLLLALVVSPVKISHEGVKYVILRYHH